jgi:hypothetical protein
MKLYFIILLLLALSFRSTAQIAGPDQEDTTAYQVQRQKINSLLSDRSAKFGQYDESLNKKTGIFGLKTKKDMQSSINILTEIVKTDNAIFRELKILLDYKDLEKVQAQEKSEETQGHVTNFMTTINKLQRQNDQLKTEIEENKDENAHLFYTLIAFVLIVSGIGWYLYKTKKLTFN